MMSKKVFMYSGQGSQYYQMGRELYHNHKSFRYHMDACNEIVQPLIGTSIIDTIYDDDKKGVPFDTLKHTNPALLGIQYSMTQVLMEKEVHPDLLIGYSLGEISAAVVAKALQLEDGLKLVVAMAQIAEERTPPAKMLAIVAEKNLVAQNPDLFEHCWISATNFQGNFVVCGLPNAIDVLERHLAEEGITTQQLAVHYGFHTPLIEGLEAEFKAVVIKIEFEDLTIPMISSLKMDYVNQLDANFFWEVVRYPVNFEKTVQRLSARADYRFIDLGPGASLATAVKYILPSEGDSVPWQLMNQFGRNLATLGKFMDSLSPVAEPQID